VNGTGPTVRPVRIVIRRIGITAASSLEAVVWLTRCRARSTAPWARIGEGVAVDVPSRPRAAERVAAAVAAAVSARLTQDATATSRDKAQ
jgi:hypothetical protein